MGDFKWPSKEALELFFFTHSISLPSRVILFWVWFVGIFVDVCGVKGLKD